MDDHDLSRRLADTLGHLDPRPVPLDAITRRARRIRRQRTGTAIAAIAAIAAVAFVLLPGNSPRPQTTPPTAPRPPVVTNTRAIGVDNVFANGAVNGKPWQLAVANASDTGTACLPAVVLNGQYADLLFPHPHTALTAAGAPSLLSGVSGFPGASFAFFRVPAPVTKLVVSVGPATRLTLTPVTENVCGQRFRLAGFGFGDTRQVRVTAYPGGAAYTSLASLLLSQGTQHDWGWQNFDLSAGPGTPHRLASGTIKGQAWTIQARIGDKGECFPMSIMRASDAANVPECAPLLVNPGPRAVIELATTPIGNSPLHGYASPVSIEVSSVTAYLADGAMVKAAPVTAGGLRFVAFATTSPVTRLTWNDAAGNGIATCSLSS